LQRCGLRWAVSSRNAFSLKAQKSKAGEVLYQIDPAVYEATYNSAKAALSRADANLVPMRLKAGRYAELVKSNAVSQQEYDDASAVLKQAEADVEAGKAAVETARINLAYTKVTAPISEESAGHQ